jgi:hypothetical protein
MCSPELVWHGVAEQRAECDAPRDEVRFAE